MPHKLSIIGMYSGELYIKFRREGLKLPLNLELFRCKMHLALELKFYFNNKKHFLMLNYNNSYRYFAVCIKLALVDVDE